MSNFSKRLKKMQDNWESASDSGFNEFPDGTYKFQLQNAEIVESQRSGKLMIHCEHVCLEGELAGDVYHQYLQLETDQSLPFVKQFIANLGREIPDNLADIEEVVSDLAEATPTYMAQVKTKGEFKNFNITRLLEGEAITATPEEGEGDPEGTEVPDGMVVDARVSVEIEGAEYEGVITEVNVEEETTSITFDDGDEQEIGWDEITVLEEDNSESEEEGITIDQLIAFAQSQDIETDDDDDEETLTVKIVEWEYKEEELMEEEVTMLKEIGATVIPAPKAKKEKKKKKKGKG